MNLELKKPYPVEVYKTTFWKKWRWRVTATNGRIIGASSQGYKNRIDCVENAMLLGESLVITAY